MTDLREVRRREYIGHFAHQYIEWGDAAVYLTVGDVTQDTLNRVVPEVAD